MMYRSADCEALNTSPGKPNAETGCPKMASAPATTPVSVLTSVFCGNSSARCVRNSPFTGLTALAVPIGPGSSVVHATSKAVVKTGMSRAFSITDS